MGRKRNKNKGTKEFSDERDTSDVASPAARPSVPPPVNQPLDRPYQEIEDRRTFHPSGPNRPARRKTGAPARLQLRDPINASQRNKAKRFWDRLLREGRRSTSLQTKAKIGFNEPERVLTCVRRQRRKEVMHALRKTKRGAGSKRRRYTWRSQLSCSTR